MREKKEGGRAERRRKGEQDRTYLNINCKNVGIANAGDSGPWGWRAVTVKTILIKIIRLGKVPGITCS